MRYGNKTRNGSVSDWIQNQDQGYVVTDKTWTRPSDWVSLPSIISTDNKFVGVLAVHDSNNTVALTATVTGGYTVNWGDGTTETFSSAATASHTYTYSSVTSDVTTDGFKTVAVEVYPTTPGNAWTVFSLQVRPSVYTYAVVTESNWLDIAISGPSLTTLWIGSSDTLGSKVVNLNNCQRVQILSFTRANCSNLLANMRSLESATISFTSSTTNINSIFQNCSSLKYVDIQGTTTSITNTSYAFLACSSLESTPNFSMSAVTNSSYMFQDCFSLKNVSLYNTSSVTTTQSMFLGCRSLENIPLLNLSSVTNTISMFQNCSGLLSVPLLNLSAVTNATSMFDGCAGLKSIPNFNLNSCLTFSAMFLNCYSLENVEMTNNNASGTKTMNEMFRGCVSLKNAVLSIKNVQTATSIFHSCYSLKNVKITNAESATNFSLLFYLCYVLENVEISGTTSSLLSTANMFNSCYSIKDIPLFDTQNVSDMAAMFQNCYSLKTVPSFNTQNVTNFNSTFVACYSLESVPLFNTSKVTGLSGTFANCDSLKYIPEFDTRLVTTFQEFVEFADVQKIKLNLSSCTNTGGTGSTAMLNGANNISSATLTGLRATITTSSCRLSASELNNLYTSLAAIGVQSIYTIQGASYSAGTQTITYTTNGGQTMVLIPGQRINIAGITPSGYNLTGAYIESVSSGTNEFTVQHTGANPGSYTSGGTTGAGFGVQTVTVTNNYGTTGDDITIATNKGWTVSG